KLINGSVINKAEEANNYNVNERSIQRDIDDIRNYMDIKGSEDGIINSVIYDRQAKGYRLEQIYKLKFTNPEILAICKILLDSRAFTKKEMDAMLAKLIESCVPAENQKLVKELIMNEKFHYIEPRHGSVFIDKMWEIGKAVKKQNKIRISYKKLNCSECVERIVQPLAIMFSEYYFYLIAFIDDTNSIQKDVDYSIVSPTIYRLDRMETIEVLTEHFYLPYKNRFEEGEFRKRIPFMYGGKLKKVLFKYSGISLEMVLDKLPTAKVIANEDDIYTIEAEVYGDGFNMWAKSQGDNIFEIQLSE
ncbi:MAG: WYL domain-containing protein, partial [Agathobacter sp.]|nr:WYL domain-containing protein [Agathobacter sp.]